MYGRYGNVPYRNSIQTCYYVTCSQVNDCPIISISTKNRLTKRGAVTLWNKRIYEEMESCFYCKGTGEIHGKGPDGVIVKCYECYGMGKWKSDRWK